jgi:hypothetical protein
MRWIGWLILLGTSMINDLAPQTRAARPRNVVAAVFAAQDSGDVATLVRLVDPEAMVEFKQRQLETDSISSLFPNEPGTKGARPRRTFLQVFFRVKDQAEFQQLPPEEVLRRWFEQQRKGRARVSMQWPAARLAKREILGEVPDTGHRVHVVFRETEAPPPMPGFNVRQDPHIRVITVRRTAGGWRVGLNGGLVFDEGGGWGIGYNDEDEAGAPPP